jgi:hypothetical protein
MARTFLFGVNIIREEPRDRQEVIEQIKDQQLLNKINTELKNAMKNRDIC